MQLAQLVIGKVKGVVLAFCSSEVCQWKQIQCIMFASLNNSGPKCKCFIRQSLVMFRWNWAPHHNTHCIAESKNLCGEHMRLETPSQTGKYKHRHFLWPITTLPTAHMTLHYASTHIEGHRRRADLKLKRVWIHFTWTTTNKTTNFVRTWVVLRFLSSIVRLDRGER